MCKGIGIEEGEGCEMLYTAIYIFTKVCITFLERLARQTEIKRRSVERLLPPKRIFIMLNVPLAKTERNTWQVLSFLSRNYTEMSNISKG